jgi:outer membrane protein assembly factor BamB
VRAAENTERIATTDNTEGIATDNTDNTEKLFLGSVCSVLSVALFSVCSVLSVASSVDAQSFPSAPLWRKEISATPVPVAPPVAAGDRLFLALESGISARRLRDGEEVWTSKLVADGPMAASEGFLIVQSGGVLHAFSAESGNEVWSAKPGKITAAPLIHQQWLFVAADEHLTAYQVSDGTERWSADLGVIEERPAFEGLHMYVPVRDGQLVALIVESGKELWRQDVGIKPTEPLVYGDRIFIGSAAKIFWCLRILDGSEDYRVPVGAAVLGRAAADARHVYYTAFDNLLYAHERRRGERRWKQDLKYRPSAGPTLIGDSVTAPGMVSTLQSFHGTTGKPTTGQLVFTEKLATVPVFFDTPAGSHVAVVTGGLNNVWALTLSGPPPVTVPALQVLPLTVLPGTSLPIHLLPIVPRE